MSITLGWWLVPSVLTLAIWFGGKWKLGLHVGRSNGGMFGDLAEAVALLFLVVPILLVWLAYFVVVHFSGADQ